MLDRETKIILIVVGIIFLIALYFIVTHKPKTDRNDIQYIVTNPKNVIEPSNFVDSFFEDS